MGTEKLLTSEVKEPGEEKVKGTLEKVLGEKIIKATLIERGAINFPYKIETEKGNLFAKIGIGVIHFCFYQ